MLEIGLVEYYSVAELVDKLDLEEESLVELIEEGEIKGKKLAGQWVVASSWLHSYLSDRE